MKFSALTESNEDEAFDINVIPLIDVLLVLLIFFMASSSFIASGGIDVKLPSASSAVVSSSPSNVSVTIHRDGKVSVEGKPVEFPALVEMMREYSSRTPKPLLVIRADEHSEHGMLVKVLDLAKQNGLDDVAIAAVVGNT